MKIRRWIKLRDSRIISTRIFDLYRRRAHQPRRGERDFYILDAPPWVNIIPMTPAGEIVMVRQWRHGISDFTLEIPGGMVDPADRSPKAAARREMLEECGYDSSRIVMLGWVHPNPAIQPNRCYSFLASGVRKIADPHFISDEETQVVLVRAGEIKNLIASRKITHALVIAAFSFFHVYNPPRAGR
ncbi:MAG: NUDIX hydrolase [Candidatus Binataceae bacterium]